MATRTRKAKMATRIRKIEVVARTTCLKQEPKVRGQSRGLKVSSFPSLHFFVVFLHVGVMSSYGLFLYV
jgi:hypothetical protein